MSSIQNNCSRHGDYDSFRNSCGSKPVNHLRHIYDESRAGTETLCSEQLVSKILKTSSKSIALLHFSSLKEINENLAYRALGEWVSVNRILIEKLAFTREGLLKISPHLTYLSFYEPGYCEEFIGEIMSKASNLSHLAIERSVITGSCLKALPFPEKLEQLDICFSPFFDVELSLFSGLQVGSFLKCSSFNQNFYQLPVCHSLKIIECERFEGGISDLPSVEHFEIIGCPKWDSPLTNLPALKNLTITLCQSFNQQLTHLPSLRMVRIHDCPLYNQDLSHCENLTSIEMSLCNSFDQEMHALPSLQRLRLESCESFNKDIKDLPALVSIGLSQCALFNGNISDLLSLQKFCLYHCKSFGKNLLGLPSLALVEIRFCQTYNGALSDLPLLKALNVDNCELFDQNLSELPELRQVQINFCNSYDGKIHDLPSLRKFECVECPSFSGNLAELPILNEIRIVNNKFNPFNYVETARIFLRLRRFSKLLTYFYSLAPERKKNVRENARGFLREIIEETTVKEQSGLSFYDELFIPPASLKKYVQFIDLSGGIQPIPHFHVFFLEQYERQTSEKRVLLDECWKRLCERYPRYVRGEEDHSGITNFIEALLQSEHGSLLEGLLKWEYKMNPSLPMTKDALNKIVRSIQRCPHMEAKIHLALQTHPSLEEIIAAIPYMYTSFPSKKDFFEITALEVQRGFLSRAVIFRERSALKISNAVIKSAVELRNYDPQLLIDSLRLLRVTSIEGSSQSIQRLLEILDSSEFSSEIAGHACTALAEIDYDPWSRERKAELLRALSRTKDPFLQLAVLESLEKYIFTSEEKDIAARLVEFSSECSNDSVKVGLAFVLSAIPVEEALREALFIVNSTIWNRIDSGVENSENLGRKGHYMMYPYRPVFHDSRANMKRVIGERMVELHRNRLARQIQVRFDTWQDHQEKEQFDTLDIIQSNILNIEDNTRYVPFPLYLPPNKAVFRGINDRKGKELSETAFIDLILKGAGSSDLSRYGFHTYGTWAKVGQIFASLRFRSLDSYFDDNGVLIVIASEAINELGLRRAIRYERESSINVISYRTIRIHQVHQLFMNIDRQAEIEKMGRLNSTIDKIAARQLKRKIREFPPLEDRISYFNLKKSVMDQIQQIMKKKGIVEATYQEIVNENIERQIVREILAEEIEDPQLKECMVFASRIIPAAVTEAHV